MSPHAGYAGRMNYRWFYPLFVAGLVTAGAIGGVLGNGHPVATHSHMLAFAVNTNNTICAADKAVGCTGLYVLNGDSVQQDRQGLGPLPPAARLLVAGTDIVGLSWSPDATEIAYLVGRRAPTGNDYFIQAIDLWRARATDGRTDLVTRNVASATDERDYRLGEAIHWIGDRPIMTAGDTWIPATAESRQFLSPDRKLMAMRQWGIDSSWICVRPPQAVQDARDTGCFGDGFFSEPVWAPF